MHKRYWPFIVLLFCTTFVGCVEVSGGGMRGFLFALISAFVFAAACVQVIDTKGENTSESSGDGGVSKDGVANDSTTKETVADAKGNWGPCCEDGKVSRCFCPEGVACNYGWYKNCGGGSCIYDPNGSCEPIPEKVSEPTTEKTPDAGPDATPDEVPEQKGTWGPCCEDGKVSSCFCPEGVACNYGWYNDCGNGVCVIEPGTCEPVPEKVAEPIPDVKSEPVPEQKGSWEACCDNGKVSSCFCPEGVACNYGWYKDCGGGSCIYDPNGSCEPIPEKVSEPIPEPIPEKAAEPIPERKGTWQQCCDNGKPSQCFCPDGVACNYFYTDCGNGTCTSGAQCP